MNVHISMFIALRGFFIMISIGEFLGQMGSIFVIGIFGVTSK